MTASICCSAGISVVPITLGLHVHQLHHKCLWTLIHVYLVAPPCLHSPPPTISSAVTSSFWLQNRTERSVCRIIAQGMAHAHHDISLGPSLKCKGSLSVNPHCHCHVKAASWSVPIATAMSRQTSYLTGAVGGAAEVTWVVIAVGLMLWLKAGAVTAIHDCAVRFHTRNCAILEATATRLCASLPCTHLRQRNTLSCRVWQPALSCQILHYAVSYCTMLPSTALCCQLLHYAVSYCMTLSATALRCQLLHNAAK